MERILTRWLDIPDLRKLEVYRAHGGYDALKKALFDWTPDQIINEVKNSNLRGRGGAAFPTGTKWSFIPKESKKPVYVCCNADESEPGTFANRYQLENDPHGIIEGILICLPRGRLAYLLRLSARRVHGTKANPRCRDRRSARGGTRRQEHHELGLRCGNMDPSRRRRLHLRRGNGTARIARGQARVSSQPAAVSRDSGAFSSPTVVNNVETLTNIPHIINRGADWYKSIGPEKSPGPKLFCLSGHVNLPGLYELPMGFPLKDLIYGVGGGILGGKQLKAVIPGGSSFPVFTADEALKVNMDFDSVRAAGSLMGTAGVMVMHDETCMVDVLKTVAHFYHHESCGQCTPCREGCGWIEKLLTDLEDGRGKMEDLQLLIDVSSNMEGNTICVLADSLSMPVKSFVPKFRSEFEDHVRLGRCPFKDRNASAAKAAA